MSHLGSGSADHPTSAGNSGVSPTIEVRPILSARTAGLINPVVKATRASLIEAKVRDESARRVRRQRYLETIAAQLVRAS